MNPEKEHASASVVVPILGMHRSGTSMFTRALNLLGLELGQPLLPPQPDNPRGFWENEFFFSVDVKILRGLGNHPSGYGSAWDLDLLPGRSASIVPSQQELATIEAYLANAFSQARAWGWKDPRTVPLFPFWLHTLVQLGFDDIRPVIIVRHPGQCVRSLVRRGDMDGLAATLSISTAALCQRYMESLPPHPRRYLRRDRLHDRRSRVVPRCAQDGERAGPQCRLLWPVCDGHASGR